MNPSIPLPLRTLSGVIAAWLLQAWLSLPASAQGTIEPIWVGQAPQNVALHSGNPPALGRTFVKIRFDSPVGEGYIWPELPPIPIDRYEFRLFPQAPTWQTWYQGVLVPPSTVPLAVSEAGIPLAFTIHDLEPATSYFLAGRAIYDGFGVDQPSGLSAVVPFETHATDLLDPGPYYFTVEPAGPNALSAFWVLPEGDGGSGTLEALASQELRLGIAPISEANFDDPAVATPLSNVPLPGAPTTSQRMTIEGLEPGRLYWVAIRGEDGGSNFSPVAAAFATTPLLPTGGSGGGGGTCSGSPFPATPPGAAATLLLATVATLLARRR